MKVVLPLTILFVLGVAQAEPQPLRARERVILRTTAGDLLLALYPEVAPQHVGQILELVRLGAYDTVEIFRIVPGFIVQLSEVESRRLPLSEPQRAAIMNLPLELSDLSHRRGMLSMARRDDDPLSARTSFSILLGDAPHLDGKYTIFGHVEAGYDVLEELARVPRDENDHPFQKVEILKAEAVSPTQALADIYLAGPKAISEAGAEARRGLRSFLVASMILMVGLSLASYALGDRVSKRVHSSLTLLVCMVGAFGLFTYWAPTTELNHLHGIAILLGVLGLLKLMGKFENPS
jgi:cyclophilin family peptidyl-prolyl cis-trans isomerase